MLALQIWLLLGYALPLLPVDAWRDLDAATEQPCFDRLRCIQGSLEVTVEPATEKEATVSVSAGATFAPTHLEEIDLPLIETLQWTNLSTGRDCLRQAMCPTLRMPALEGTLGGFRSSRTQHLPPGRYLIRVQYEVAPAGSWRPLWARTAIVKVAPDLTHAQAIELEPQPR